MTRSQQHLLSQLATSGLGQCLETLRLISALPRACNAGLCQIHLYHIAHHQSVWLRTPLSRPSPPLFYRENGTIDPTPVLVNEDSWKELAPYVHTLHVEDDLERPSTTLSSRSTTLAGTMVSGVMGVSANGNGPTASSSMTFSLSGKGSGLILNALDAISIKTRNEGLPNA
ncbi:hypothetical protein L210DRAFT_3645928 [Boletus edulis BED1]|uniref:Uncharacterized protein n=1 Tax=Boletus edulis BED1 TaxID=1328754 RepID=A0AAD4GEK5_BOLED|nr:hypothetical protein L210DRAFT_3645928 [Boletus edulis BED1]